MALRPFCVSCWAGILFRFFQSAPFWPQTFSECHGCLFGIGASCQGFSLVNGWHFGLKTSNFIYLGSHASRPKSLLSKALKHNCSTWKLRKLINHYPALIVCLEVVFFPNKHYRKIPNDAPKGKFPAQKRLVCRANIALETINSIEKFPKLAGTFKVDDKITAMTKREHMKVPKFAEQLNRKSSWYRHQTEFNTNTQCAFKLRCADMQCKLIDSISSQYCQRNGNFVASSESRRENWFWNFHPIIWRRTTEKFIHR